MPVTIVVGGRGARSQFNEWTGPEGTDPTLDSFARNPKNPVPLPVPPHALNFVSNNTLVATVDSSGNITAVAPGTAIITCTDTVSGLHAIDTVTVVAPAPTVSATLTLINN